jgi:hypothetical protein
MGKGVKRIERKHIVEDTKHTIKLLEIKERTSYPFFNAAFPFHEAKK